MVPVAKFWGYWEYEYHFYYLFLYCEIMLIDKTCKLVRNSAAEVPELEVLNLQVDNDVRQIYIHINQD
jgi:hypothetical protein